MAKAFDTSQYTSDFSPIAKSPFVSVQDVMSDLGDIGQEIVQLIPELLKVFNLQQLGELITSGLTQFIDVIFPTDGSSSPLLGGLLSAIEGTVSTVEGLPNQLTSLVISLLPQIFSGLTSAGGALFGFVDNIPILGQLVSAVGGNIGASNLLTEFVSHLGADVGDVINALTSAGNLLSGFTGGSSILGQLPALLALPISAITNLGGFLTNLTSGGIFNLSGLASGALPSGVTAAISQIAALPGYLTHLASNGIVALEGLASGVLPSGVTAAISQISSLGGYLTHLTSGGGFDAAQLFNIGNIPALAVSAITGLSGFLTNLSSGGVFNLSGLASGALPAGITAAVSQISSLAGYLTHLTSAGLFDAAQLFNVGNIPALAVSAVSGLSGFLQNLTSGGVLALSGLASGTLPGGIQLPGGQITGSIAAALLSGVLDVSHIPALAVSAITGLSGFLTNLTSGGVFNPAGLAAGALPAGVTAVVSQIQSLGGYLTHLTTAGLFDAAQLFNVANIPALAISSVQNLGGYLTNIASNGIVSLQALATGTLPAGISTPINQVLNLASQLLTMVGATTTAQKTAVAANTVLTQQASAKPNYLATDSTADGPYPIANLTGATAQYVPVTQGNSVCCFIDTTGNTTKSSVPWLGQTTTGLTGFYVNIYQLNVITGVATLLEASANIISNVSNALAWNYMNLATPINAGVGNIYLAEIVVTGTGSYQIAGITSDWKPANGQAAYPHMLGSLRYPITPGATSGITSNAGAITTLTVNHTPLPTDTYVVTWAAWASNATTTNATVKYGSTTMTPTASGQPNGASGNGALAAFVCPITPSANPATVAITVTFATAVLVASLQNVSYGGVASVTAGTYSDAATATPSQTVSSSATTGAYICHSFMSSYNTGTTSTTISPYTNTALGQAQRANVEVLRTAATAWSMGHVVGDCPGAASVPFAATQPVAAAWLSLDFILNPITTAANCSVPSFTPNYTGVTPWIGLANVLFSGPAQSQFPTAGTYTYTIPSWMKYGDQIDLVMLSGGGGGQGSAAYFVGNGGGCGQWFAQTLTYGIDIPIGTTTLTLVVGAGGAGQLGGSNASGYTGGDSTCTGTGVTITLDAPGGPGGGNAGGNTGGNQNGIAPAPFTFNTILYTPASPNGTGGLGAAAYGAGSAGKQGEIWVTAYQAGRAP